LTFILAKLFFQELPMTGTVALFSLASLGDATQIKVKFLTIVASQRHTSQLQKRLTVGLNSYIFFIGDQNVF